MNVNEFNQLLSHGEIDRDDMWPRLIEFESKAATFRFEFGLDELPIEPGLIVIRGPRQYGKSTWLDLNLRDTIHDFGKGTAYYLNGDEVQSVQELEEKVIDLGNSFHRQAKVKRLFIDEVTSVPQWEKAIKRLWDRGYLRDVLIVTTGSKAFDLRRGTEKLPGRKGRLPKTEFVFLPVSYRDFHSQCSSSLGDKTWIAYLLSGGSPIGCNDIFQFEKLPEYFVQLVRDWVLGEIVSTGRSRLFLSAVFKNLYKWGGTPVGYAKLARESGLANNTVASGYIDQLSDLLCVMPAFQWDSDKDVFEMRKPCKFHFINLACAIAFYPGDLRYVHEYENLSSQMQGIFLEWLVSQEIWRRSVLEGKHNPEAMAFWKSREREVDFITPDRKFIEVKRGKAGPLEFSWFNKIFPRDQLTVVCSTPFESKNVRGVTIDQFLLSG